MTVKSALLPSEKARQIQRTAGNFNCRLQRLAVAANKQARVVVAGEEEDLKALFESIGEILKANHDEPDIQI